MDRSARRRRGHRECARAQQSQIDFAAVEIHLLPVQGNVHMLVGAGGNVTVQVGKQGVLLVDTEFGPLVPKIMAEVRKLSSGPLRYIINTHVHGDHVGGNEATGQDDARRQHPAADHRRA